MKKNKYLLMISSIGVLLLLVGAAVSENFLKEWQTIQRASATAEGPAEIRLRQIVNPAMRKSDRCVSCHVGMTSGEQITTSLKVGAAHKPVVHSPTEFGCTVCHGGQGQATTKEDAHGTAEFWPEPMLAAKYAYAGCGTCHTPLNVPNLARYDAAEKTFERLDCYACHRIETRGGTLRPGGVTGMEGPDLSRTGIKGYDKNWYDSHLAKSRGDDGPWKNSFREVADQDRELLTVFLDTQMGASKLVRAKAQFNSLGCAGCHKVGNFGGDLGLELTQVGYKDPATLSFVNVTGKHTLENYLVEHFRSPATIVPGSQMPTFGLNDDQIDLLTMYMLSLRRRALPDIYVPKDRLTSMRFGGREFAADGETVFTAVCSSCHGFDGSGRRFGGVQHYPAITNPDFLALASDDFLFQTAKLGRPGRQMLAWGERENGFSDDQLRAVVAYIRQLGGNVATEPDTRPRRWAAGDVNLGAQLFASNCAGCHGKSAEGADGPALKNKVLMDNATDTYLVGTITRGRRGTVMQGFGTSTPVRRELTQPEIEAIVVYLRSLTAN